MPDGLGDNTLDLVIDAADVGNETRYINSVNSHTALFIRQNATMNTVWCRGAIRIIIEVCTSSFVISVCLSVDCFFFFVRTRQRRSSRKVIRWCLTTRSMDRRFSATTMRRRPLAVVGLHPSLQLAIRYRASVFFFFFFFFLRFKNL
jgi:hypothetical protein